MHNQFSIAEQDGSITEYVIDNNGVIKQLYPKKYVYDATYSGIYDTPKYQENSERLQLIRLAVSTTHTNVRRVLDVGYGNGAFLDMAIKRIPIDPGYTRVAGYDITGVEVPEGCERIYCLPVYASSIINNSWFDLITFWDCLEHFPDLSFVRGLMASTVAVSLPWCHFMQIAAQQNDPSCFGAFDKAVEWFKSWHHRKPNEHLHHFNPDSLKLTMASLGWKLVSFSNIEDMIRKPRDERENILTAVFTKA